jgi:outer membrane protein assembly factor BamD
MRKFLILPLFLLLLSCGGKKVATEAPGSDLDEPDKVLFDRAKRDLDKNKFTVARLTLNTLINTYPDSEFLPQAKYAMAESFYRENSSGALNQAEAEFKDYITFFPASELADDAQLKVAMTHVRRMEKADRDRTQAMLAEAELKTMVETYPDSPLLEETKEKLRAVQEVLADGVFKIGNFYLLRKSYPAAVDRYQEILKKYPDFSRAPDALFNLAEAFRHANNPESAIYYARIISEYPLSEHVNDAKERLTAMNQPIPEPNPVALARAQQVQRDDRGILRKTFGVFSRRPPVPTDTDAASSEEQAGEQTDNKDGSSGTFTIDPKVVQPGKAPVKKLR